jgi:hypothetical protein
MQLSASTTIWSIKRQAELERAQLLALRVHRDRLQRFRERDGARFGSIRPAPTGEVEHVMSDRRWRPAVRTSARIRPTLVQLAKHPLVQNLESR